MVRFDLPAFPDLYRTRPLHIHPRSAYCLWFELRALCDDWAMALDRQQFFVQALVDTLPRVAQQHADDEFIQRLVEAARDLSNRARNFADDHDHGEWNSTSAFRSSFYDLASK